MTVAGVSLALAVLGGRALFTDPSISGTYNSISWEVSGDGNTQSSVSDEGLSASVGARTLEIRGASVLVNGIDHGQVARDSTVTLRADGALYVNGNARGPAPAPPPLPPPAPAPRARPQAQPAPAPQPTVVEEHWHDNDGHLLVVQREDDRLLGFAENFSSNGVNYGRVKIEGRIGWAIAVSNSAGIMYRGRVEQNGTDLNFIPSPLDSQPPNLHFHINHEP